MSRTRGRGWSRRVYGRSAGWRAGAWPYGRRLHGPELLVAQHGGERIEVGVGAQHEDAVELGVLLRLGLVDGEVAVAFGLEEAAEAGVADQRLVTPGQLTFEVGQDGVAPGGVHLGLLMVAAQDVVSTVQGHRFGLQFGIWPPLVIVGGTHGAASVSTNGAPVGSFTMPSRYAACAPRGRRASRR